MTDLLPRSFWLIASAALAVTALAALPWGAQASLGVLAGGGWNLANFSCLNRVLAAWLGPGHSRRRVVGWLLIKFPLLYLAAYGLLTRPGISPAGFGVGFSVVLVSALAALAARARSLASPASHGR